MSAELQRAVVREAKSDATLTGLIGTRIYYGTVQADTPTMPYVTFEAIAGERRKTFAAGGCWTDELVQFSIFDKNRGVGNVEAIYDALVGALDRTSLTWAGGRWQVGCELMNKSGPTWVEDCWQMTCDFMISVG